ncbi:Holliday junction branch migration protein RuvA, partial [Brucella ceti]
MIGKLKGVIDEIAEDHAVIDVHGVGYVAFCSARTLGNLGGAGEAAILFIETYVREDMIRLYGFATQLEREWFRLLQNVQGVGAKVALAVLGTLSPSELANAIALRDIAMVSRAPGVGKKVAERIVTELKNKAPAFAGEASGTIGLKQELGAGAAPAPVADAVSALSNLGYSRDQAANAVAAALKETGEGADSA